MNLVSYLCALLWVSFLAVATTANTRISRPQNPPSLSSSTSTWSISSLSKIRTDIDLDETGEVEILIEDIARRLKQFIEPGSFLHHEFDSQMMVLQEQLYVAASNAKVTIPCIHLEDKLKYTQHIFHVMCTSSEHMKRYNFFWQTDEHLVHCMSKLNAQLLGLYEVDGSPDVNSDEFEQDVISYISSVDLWKHEFESLCDVSFKTRAIFKIQTFRAEASLRVLRSFVKFSSWISRYPLWESSDAR
ncbi:hypothetical protein OXX79_004916 [Metschnikowia pulcherrima]